jgi:hypothetical protein
METRLINGKYYLVERKKEGEVYWHADKAGNPVDRSIALSLERVRKWAKEWDGKLRVRSVVLKAGMRTIKFPTLQSGLEELPMYSPSAHMEILLVAGKMISAKWPPLYAGPFIKINTRV